MGWILRLFRLATFPVRFLVRRLTGGGPPSRARLRANRMRARR